MKKLICILLVMAGVGGMFYFSSQDGKSSTKQSNAVVEIADKIFDEARDKITLKDARLIKMNEKIQAKLKTYSKSFLVRKGAHFSIYALIGGSLLLVIYLFSKKIIFSSVLSFILSVSYAIFDESRQLGIDGRSGSIKDVFIDSTGALTAILIITVILLMKHEIKKLLKIIHK